MAYPTYAALNAFAVAAGVVSTEDNHLDYRRIAQASIERWEAETNLTGEYSLADSCPADVTHALLCLGATMLVPTNKGTSGLGAVQQIKQDDLQINYAAISTTASQYSAQQLQLMAEYDAAVKRYRRLVII